MSADSDVREGGSPARPGVAPLPPGRVALVGLFVTALVTAQVTASKVLAFDVPLSLPVTGDSLVLPGAALAIAVMFFASDCYAELYGKRAAQVLVNVAFAMNFVVLALVWTTIAAPVYQFSPVGAATFESVLGASTNVVIGSLVAYLVSQNWDVLAFHWLREYTDGDALWLRNLGSTATSQALDTVIFVSLAFLVVPALRDGDPLTLGGVAALVVGQYLLKVGVAVLDTPLVYLVVGAIRRRERAAGTRVAAD